MASRRKDCNLFHRRRSDFQWTRMFGYVAVAIGAWTCEGVTGSDGERRVEAVSANPASPEVKLNREA